MTEDLPGERTPVKGLEPSAIEKAIAESAEDFLRQFDPADHSHHKSQDTRLVNADKVKKVPHGATEYSEDPVNDPPPSEAVLALIEVRGGFGVLKKKMSEVAHPVQNLVVLQSNEEEGSGIKVFEPVKTVETSLPFSGLLRTASAEAQHCALAKRDQVLEEIESALADLKTKMGAFNNLENTETSPQKREELKPFMLKTKTQLEGLLEQAQEAVQSVIRLVSPADRLTNMESFGHFLISLSYYTRKIHNIQKTLLDTIKEFKQLSKKHKH